MANNNINSSAAIYVVGIGMVTPVGFNTDMTAASVRAGINQYVETKYYNKYREPMKLALVPDDYLPELNPELGSLPLTLRQRRLLRLATPAMHELLANLSLKKPLPLFLAGPESLPECASGMSMQFIKWLQTQTECPIEQGMSRILAQGRAGGMQAIDMAFRYFESTSNDYALIGGIDSYYDPYLLGTLDKEDRLLSSFAPDGFVPGEAACFLLVASEQVHSAIRDKVLLELSPPALTQEAGHRYNSDVPYRGEGLASAFAQAIQQAKPGKIKTIYSSMNGESLSAKEYGVSMLRHQRYFDTHVSHEHPAECFGDIGAAFLPVIIGLNAMHKQKQSALGPALAYCASDQALRGAICLNS
jgi:3-oxoacyl-[acyl-carrier-protein] synthase-1